MRKAKQAVKGMAGRPPGEQIKAAEYGLPYQQNPAVFDLALRWQTHLAAVQSQKKPARVFAPCKPYSLEAGIIGDLKDASELINRAFASGRARDLRDLADAIERLAGPIREYNAVWIGADAPAGITDPLRAAMLYFAAREYRISTGALFYDVKPPINLPFTYGALVDHLSNKLDSPPEEKSVRRAAKEMGWVFKPDKRGRKPGK